MKITQLEYFCATCRHHSITQAARELYVTQPAISSAIRELEKEFSINLFVRLKKTMLHSQKKENYFIRKPRTCCVILKKALRTPRSWQTDSAGPHWNPPLLSTVYFPDIYVNFQIHPEIHLNYLNTALFVLPLL